MWLRYRIFIFAGVLALGACGLVAHAQAQAQAQANEAQLHVLAIGVDGAGTAVTSVLPTRLGSDTKELAHALEDANVPDVHLLVNEATVRIGPLAPDPVDIELDRMQRSFGPQDTLMVTVGARLYTRDAGTTYFVDLDKFGTDFPLAHLLVRLRQMPCANVVLVLPGVMGTAMDINLHRYIESFPKGTGVAANIELLTSTTRLQNEMHSPLLQSLAKGLRGDADSNRDGVISAQELNQYVSSLAAASRPTSLQKMDPYFTDTVSWTVNVALTGSDFNVLSRSAQAKAESVGAAVAPSAPAVPAMRGATVTAAEEPAKVAVHFPKTYAVLFATNHYDYWPALTNPIPDARALQAVLHDDYGVQTELVPDATAEDIVKVLLRYIAMKYEDDAQLIVFFSGHGDYTPSMGLGYLTTRDSKLPDADPARRTFLSFDDVKRYVGLIPAKHVLLIADSCFAGALDSRTAADSGTRGDNVDRIYAPRPLAEVISLQVKYLTRRYIAAGGKEYVPDGRPGEHSPFTRALLQTLTRDADEHGYTRWRDLQAGLEAVKPSPQWNSLDARDDLNGDIILLTPAMREKLVAGGGDAARH